ncbi:MAG: hypothetical protein ABSF00_10660 [Candidatus Bathyarchaeia archaeon]|jgi:hypothetical protein
MTAETAPNYAAALPATSAKEKLFVTSRMYPVKTATTIDKETSNHLHNPRNHSPI